MDRITKSYLDAFSKHRDIENDDESVQFEKFVNYLVLKDEVADQIDLGDVTTGPNDCSIDGVGIVVDEELVLTPDDAILIFESNKKKHDAEIIFLQAKTSDKFDLGEYLKFESSIKSFIRAINNGENYDTSDEVLRNAFSIANVLNGFPIA